MKRSAPYLSDQVLTRSVAKVIGQECAATAVVLDHIAEFDTRKLYLPAAYQSMYAYCLGELHLSEDAAYKRIQAARAASRFPAILDAVSEGRLHLSGACLLAPYLTEDTAGELITAATHRTKPEIERLLANRFPRPDVPTLVQPISGAPPPAPAAQLAPGQVGMTWTEQRAAGPEPSVPASDEPQLAPGQVQALFVPAPADDRARVKPLGSGRYAVQFTMNQSAQDKLRYAQELLGHQIPAGDVAQLFERALDALIPQLEKQRFAATSKPRPSRRRESKNPRYVPADVQRAVWERDQGQCTFESENGRRCQARADLEFDHVQEVARGGEATVSGIRLRCRAHNQYQAECTFGAEFMRHKRIAAAEARTAARARAVRLETAATGGP